MGSIRKTVDPQDLLMTVKRVLNEKMDELGYVGATIVYDGNSTFTYPGSSIIYDFAYHVFDKEPKRPLIQVAPSILIATERHFLGYVTFDDPTTSSVLWNVSNALVKCVEQNRDKFSNPFIKTIYIPEVASEFLKYLEPNQFVKLELLCSAVHEGLGNTVIKNLFWKSKCEEKMTKCELESAKLRERDYKVIFKDNFKKKNSQGLIEINSLADPLMIPNRHPNLHFPYNGNQHIGPEQNPFGFGFDPLRPGRNDLIAPRPRINPDAFPDPSDPFGRFRRDPYNPYNAFDGNDFI
uniref:PI31_Prot_N domain-containing protein n=1 Tax=Rhabditophanes sp. KR3021 TaxID=114890 RepID=A0AC35TQS7_9BILA